MYIIIFFYDKVLYYSLVVVELYKEFDDVIGVGLVFVDVGYMYILEGIMEVVLFFLDEVKRFLELENILKDLGNLYRCYVEYY